MCEKINYMGQVRTSSLQIVVEKVESPHKISIAAGMVELAEQWSWSIDRCDDVRDTLRHGVCAQSGLRW
jgi:hypothetical protein